MEILCLTVLYLILLICKSTQVTLEGQLQDQIRRVDGILAELGTLQSTVAGLVFQLNTVSNSLKQNARTQDSISRTLESWSPVIADLDSFVSRSDRSIAQQGENFQHWKGDLDNFDHEAEFACVDPEIGGFCRTAGPVSIFLERNNHGSG